jgi:methylenetetrahydrofolate--tRNA-(uracil-5-)-methyltransferase
MKTVTIIGAGLAGSEAAYQLAKRGFKVRLHEMRPVKMTPAHHTNHFAELVCSNSLRGNHLNQAVGVMKEEMRMLDSLIIKMADIHQVPAGSALAVDREGFSKAVTDYLSHHDNIEIVHEEVSKLPEGPVIIATGPLTSDALMAEIKTLIDEDTLYFFDAAAPIIDADSINMDICYKKSRYDKGTADYINCPMNKEQYERFYHELINAECTEVKTFELKVFEGCMPIEEMARRGIKTMLFGPLKPVGLAQDQEDKPYAVIQLRQDDARASLYNIVGFQTHLKFGEQKRIIQMVPGLENARIMRYGVMHKNAFLNAPTLLDETYNLKKNARIFFAGQIAGVEGYVESAASAIVASINMAAYLEGKDKVIFPIDSVIGAQADYIAHANSAHFQPMNANFGLLKELDQRVNKKEKKEALAKRALNAMDSFIKYIL